MVATLESEPISASSAALAEPAAAEATVAFISGVTSEATVASTAYWTWRFDDPATYGYPPNGTQSIAGKWGSTTLSESGTAGGNVTYWFDPGSAWTQAEQNAFVAALDLWSAVANITFSAAANADIANIQFVRGSGSVAAATPIDFPRATIGSGTVGALFPHTITIGNLRIVDPSQPFSTPGANGLILHEIGHALGLGHSGPYNLSDGLGSIPARQFSVYDSTLWTIMSYISPTWSTARLFNSYPVTGTDWNPSPLSLDGAPATPMMLDIQAIQRIYGAPVTGPLAAGGVTFGFNCDIPGTWGNYFDFTINQNPVVTLWARGSGNTLDLSGFPLPASGPPLPVTINLAPGSFSSANGMVNNIAIAADTIIETAIGGPGNDTIVGNHVANVLRGLAGDDLLDGGPGADWMLGGPGGDTYVVDDPGDVVDETVSPGTITTGFDTVRSSLSYTLALAIENLVLTGSAILGEGNAHGNVIFGNNENNVLRGLGGDDSLWGLIGNDHITGGPGGDILVGGDGTDTASYTTYTNYVAVPLVVDLLDPNAGTGDAAGDSFDSIENVDGSGGNDRLLGTDDLSVNVINGLAGDDFLVGRGGLDVLRGSSGQDFIYGGNDGDQLFGGPDNDQLTGGAGVDLLDGETGYDWARYDDLGEHPDGTYFIDLVGRDNTGDTRISIEGIVGSRHVDVIGGNDDSNDLWGLDGNDNLVGRGGIDFLHGGAGADALNGGADFDWVMYDDAPAGVVAALANPALNTGFAAGDTYFLIEGISGSAFGDTLIGGGTVDWLVGQDGNDTLRGAGGADVLNGGGGIDTADYSDSGVAVNVSLFSGTGAGGTAQDDVLGEVENISGSPHGDSLVGNDDTNRLAGANGHDTLKGLGGADTLEGGAGNDTLHGHAGNDSAIFTGNRSSYRLSFLPNGEVQILDQRPGSPDGTDTLRDVENIVFADRTVAPVAPVPDVLWRHSEGTVATSDYNFGAIPLTWQTQGVGDFDADGDGDILWRHQDGLVVLWEMENGQYLTNHNIAFASVGWEIVNTGDFDDDGDSDVLWRHRDGAVVTWEMENGGYVVNHNIAFASIGWTMQGVGDFDDDGDDDIIWRHRDGAVVTWEMENGGYVVNHNIAFASTGWEIRGTGDFDGDGDDDILWHHRGDGAVVAWEMENNAYIVNHNIATTGGTWEIAGTLDFGHDGTDDILWRHADGTVVTWQMSHLNFVQTRSFGTVGNDWQIRDTGVFEV